MSPFPHLSGHPRVQLAAAVAAALFVCGGCADAGGTHTAVGSGWERLPDGPLGGRVSALVAGLGGDEVIVAGGWEWLCPPNADCAFPDLPMLADGAVVDLGTGEWRPVADAPYGFVRSASTVVGDRLHVLTGCRSGPGCDGPQELLVYDVGDDTWSRRAELPVDDAWVSVLVAVGERVLAVSSSDEYGEVPDHLYDPSSDTWRPLPDDPLPRSYDRYVVADGDRLLAFGSVVDGPAKVAAAYDLASREWTRLPDAPGGGYQVWRSGGEAWLNPHFGGDGGGGGVLDLATDTWSAFPEPPDDPGWRGDLAGLVGPDGAAYEYDHGWVRDTRTGTWREVPDRSPTTYDESVAAAGTALVVFGGQDWGETGGAAEGRLVADAWVWRPPA